MKTLTALAMILSFHAPLFADDTAADFESRKAEAVKEIDGHIAKLNEHRTCVSGAKDKEAMKTCREAMKDFRHDKRMDRMEERKERMEKKIDRMKSK